MISTFLAIYLHCGQNITGWSGAVIWNERGGYYLLKASAVSSGKLYVILPYNVSIKQS